MKTYEKIIKAIYNAIDDVNEVLPKGRQLEKSLNTVLFDRSGKIDSLELVMLIVATERYIGDQFNVAITLADEKAVSQKKSPFKTIQSFIDYINLRVKEIE